jgi:MYXO-CTERM domain-containing protein
MTSAQMHRNRAPAGVALGLCLAAGLACSVGISTASAAVQFQTGNIQYTNVNFASEAHGFTVTGEVDHLGVFVDFNGYGAGPGFSPVELHAQHGVAFVEAFNPADQLFRLTMRAQAGYAFSNIDWKLDAFPPDDGFVTFAALDSADNPIAVVGGLDTFAISHNGENPFHVHADVGTPIYTLVITSTVPLHNMKQVSVEVVPTPGAASLLGVAGVALARRRRR